MSQQIIDTHQNQKMPNIGRLLLENGKITPQDTERILKKQKDDGIRFGDAAKQLGLISEDDLQHVLSKQFDYAYLPLNSVYSKDLIAAFQPFSVTVEGFRALRSQILFRWLNEGFKAFSVTSPNSGEGVSFIAANLAVVFSQLGKNTLLIDANMRAPRIDQIFKLKQSFGLSDVLADRISGSEALVRVADFPNLTVLGAGTVPPNPQELIGRPAFADIIKNAGLVFDVIIIDSPAHSVGADAQMLASFTGGAVLVSKLNETTITDLKSLKQQIEASGASVLGAVLNNY